jgi:hypothetical protein
MSSLAEVSASVDRAARDGGIHDQAGVIRIPILRDFTIGRDSRIPNPPAFYGVGRGARIALYTGNASLPWVPDLQMLKIQRSMRAGNVRFALSGRIENQHLAALQRLIDEDAQRGTITLDLREVRLVDREAVDFLARCEAHGIRLRNCPAYLREWIASVEDAPANPPRKTRG